MLKISTVSLEEINNTVHIPNPNAGFFRKLWAFSGPGALVAVGYMRSEEHTSELQSLV